VLEVVEHEQELAAPQVSGKILDQRLAPARSDTASPCGSREDETGVPERREADEQDAVGKLVEELGSDLNCDPGLARTAGPGQGDEPDVRAPEQLRHLADLALAADQGGRLRRQVGPHRRTALLPRNGIRGRKLGIVIQDLSLDALKGRARLDPELVDENGACVLKGLQCICLPSIAVQSEHQLGAYAFAERVVGNEALELGNDLRMSAECELRVDLLFHDRQTPLFEP
jgi:hypothetical protein